MRLAVAASPDVAIPTLNALLDSKHSLIRVISQPDKPAGRGKKVTPTPVSEWAVLKNIDLARPSSNEEMSLAVEDVDCVVTIGFGQLLPEEILQIPKYGFLNLHFSILPRWRGAAPVQRAIEAGDLLSGVTVFKLDAGMDTGPIYTTYRFALDDDISSDDLLIELGELGVGAVLDALEKIENGERPVRQSEEGATRAHKLSREEAKIDWSLDAKKVSAKIRAFTSNPGAWSNFRGLPIKISAPAITDEKFAPGEISLQGKRILIGTGSTALEIGFITSAGKSTTPAAAWANGARLSPGERCE
jgi:methionyl-tRNA formyltransferase